MRDELRKWRTAAQLPSLWRADVRRHAIQAVERDERRFVDLADEQLGRRRRARLRTAARGDEILTSQRVSPSAGVARVRIPDFMRSPSTDVCRDRDAALASLRSLARNCGRGDGRAARGRERLPARLIDAAEGTRVIHYLSQDSLRGYSWIRASGRYPRTGGVRRIERAVGAGEARSARRRCRQRQHSLPPMPLKRGESRIRAAYWSVEPGRPFAWPPPAAGQARPSDDTTWLAPCARRP